MSEITFFKIKPNVSELKGETVLIEREIQTIIEKNMYEFFGVQFLASEYAFDGGRMDSLGIDENYSPVIFEYKRETNENVINQGLFYLNWLLGHKDSFYLLVLKKLGKEAADKIDWSIPRVLCVAGDFNKYDEEAIKQINRKVTLFRYRKYGEDLILFEQLNTNNVSRIEYQKDSLKKNSDVTFAEHLEKAPLKIKELFNEIKDFALNLDDVNFEELSLYCAFKKIKNFCTVVIKDSKIKIYLKLNPDDYKDVSENIRDVSKIGHWGTGNLEFNLSSEKDLEIAKKLILDSYNNN